MSLGWGLPTDVEVGHRSSLLGGAHQDSDVTLNEGGSVLLAAGRRMCQTTENGQRGCKTGEGKITQSSLNTTDTEHILTT